LLILSITIDPHSLVFDSSNPTKTPGDPLRYQQKLYPTCWSTHDHNYMILIDILLITWKMIQFIAGYYYGMTILCSVDRKLLNDHNDTRKIIISTLMALTLCIINMVLVFLTPDDWIGFRYGFVSITMVVLYIIILVCNVMIRYKGIYCTNKTTRERWYETFRQKEERLEENIEQQAQDINVNKKDSLNNQMSLPLMEN